MDLRLFLLLLLVLLLLLAATHSESAESCLLAVRCQHQYVLTPIQMHYAVSDVVVRQGAYV